MVQYQNRKKRGKNKTRNTQLQFCYKELEEHNKMAKFHLAFRICSHPFEFEKGKKNNHNNPRESTLSYVLGCIQMISFFSCSSTCSSQ